jgi:hypothetical protein
MSPVSTEASSVWTLSVLEGAYAVRQLKVFPFRYIIPIIIYYFI